MIPTIVAPTYETKLISLPKPITFRPYLVKEEKILLMAQQGNDPKEVERAVKQILQACTFDVVDINKLPSFDVEFLFLQVRSRSVNNIVELHYECKNRPAGQLPLDDGVCHHVETISVNLDDIKVVVPEGHTNKIMVTDTIGVILRYPTTEEIEIFSEAPASDALDLLIACILNVFTIAGEVYEASEAAPGEIKTFVESLSLTQAKRFGVFFENLPHLTYTFTFKCSKCEYTEDITLNGLMDFFD